MIHRTRFIAFALVALPMVSSSDAQSPLLSQPFLDQDAYPMTRELFLGGEAPITFDSLTVTPGVGLRVMVPPMSQKTEIDFAWDISANTPPRGFDGFVGDIGTTVVAY